MPASGGMLHAMHVLPYCPTPAARRHLRPAAGSQANRTASAPLVPKLCRSAPPVFSLDVAKRERPARSRHPLQVFLFFNMEIRKSYLLGKVMRIAVRPLDDLLRKLKVEAESMRQIGTMYFPKDNGLSLLV